MTYALVMRRSVPSPPSLPTSTDGTGSVAVHAVSRALLRRRLSAPGALFNPPAAPLAISVTLKP
jgi:hypothetical protein